MRLTLILFFIIEKPIDVDGSNDITVVCQSMNYIICLFFFFWLFCSYNMHRFCGIVVYLFFSYIYLASEKNYAGIVIKSVTCQEGNVS